MKIYIASSFSLIPRVEALAKILEEKDHKITVKWWKRIYQNEDLGSVDTQQLKKEYEDLEPNVFYSKPETRASYLEDLKGIEDAEVFILVAADIPRNYGGANIELGYALASGLLCLSLGKLENSALYFDVIRCKDHDEIINILGDNL